MGDIADDMLEGFLCQQCGEMIDGEEPGHPEIVLPVRVTTRYMRERDKMICPILSTDSAESDWMMCQKEKCQWWINGNCVVHEYLHLIPVLKDIQSEIFKGFQKVCDTMYNMRKSL